MWFESTARTSRASFVRRHLGDLLLGDQLDPDGLGGVEHRPIRLRVREHSPTVGKTRLGELLQDHLGVHGIGARAAHEDKRLRRRQHQLGRLAGGGGGGGLAQANTHDHHDRKDNGR